MSLLEQNTTKKGRVNKNNVAKLDTGDNKGGEHKIKAICDSVVYTRESKSGFLSGVYYLVF